eukprot:jgi/Mesvir1/15008/Mv14666-RA.1
MESREINNRVFRCDNGEMKLMSKFGISLSAPSVDISAQTLRVNNAPLSSLQISDGAITTEKLDPDLLARLPAASDLYKPFTGSFTASPYVWRFPAEDNSRIAFVNPATAAATLQGNTKRVVVRGGLDVDSITFNNAGGAFRGVTGFDTDAVTASPNDGPVLKYLANTAGASQGYMFGATQPVANVGGNQQRVVITGGLNVDRAEVQAIGGVTLDEITSITVLDQGGDPLTSTHRVKEVTVVFGSDVATGSFTANDVNASFVYSSTLPLSDAVSGLTNVSGDSRTFRFVLTIPDVIAKGTQGQVLVTVPMIVGGVVSSAGHLYTQKTASFPFAVPEDLFVLSPQTPVLGASAPDTVAVTFDYVSQSVLDDTYGTNGVITNKVSASARFNAPDFFSQPSTYVNGGGALTASLANDSNGERKILRIVLTAPVPDGAYQAQFEVYITSSAVRNALALGCESKRQRWDMDLRTEDTLNLQQYTVTLTSADVAQFSLTFDKDIAALGQEFTATLQSALSARVDASSHQWQAYDASKWEVVANPAPELTAAKTLQFRVDFRKIKTAPLDSGIKGVLLSLAPGALFATVNNSQGQPMTTHPITKMVGTPLTFTAPTNRPLLSDALVAFNNADWQNNGYLYVVFNYTRAMQAGSGHAYADVVVDTLSGSVTGSELVGSITTTDPTPTTYANSPTQRVMRYNLTAAIAALGSANAARLTLRVTPRHDLTPADTYGITMQAWTGAPISRSTDLPTESTAYVVEGVTVTRDLYRSGGQSSVTTPNVSSFDLRIQFSTRFAVLAADLADVSSLLGFRNVSGSSTANKGIVVEYSQTPLLPLLVQYKAKDPNNMYLDIVVTPWVRNTRDGGKVENFPPPSVDAKFKVTIAANRFRPSQATSRHAGKPVNEQIIGTNHGNVTVTKATTTKIRIRLLITTTLLPNQGSIKFTVPDFAFSDTFNVGNGLFEVGRVSTPYSYVTSYNRIPTQSVLVTLDPGYPNVSNPYELRFTVTFAIAPEGFTANPQSSTETVIDSGSAGWSALVKEHVPKTPPSGEYEPYTRTANVRFVSSAGDKSFTYSAKLSASNWSGQTGSQIQVAFQWSSFQVSSERAEFPSAVSDVIATTSGFGVRAIAIDEVEGEDDQIEVTFSLRGSLTHYNNAPRTDGPHDVNFVTKATILNDFETGIRLIVDGVSFLYTPTLTPRIYIQQSTSNAKEFIVTFDFSFCHRLPTLDVVESDFTLFGYTLTDVTTDPDTWSWVPATHELVSFTRGAPGSMVWTAVARITEYPRDRVAPMASIMQDIFQDSAGVKNYATDSDKWQELRLFIIPPMWRWKFWVQTSRLQNVMSTPIILDVRYVSIPLNGTSRQYPSAASILESLNAVDESGVRKVTMSFQKSEIEATGQTVGLFYLGLTETNFDMFRLSVNVAWFAGAPGTIKLTLPADLAPVDAEGFSNERVYDITIDKSGVSVTVAAGTITLYLPVGVLDAAGDTNADTWVTVDFLQATPYQPSIQVSTRAPDQGAVKYMKADITFPRDVTGFASDSIKIRQQAPESAKGWKFELGDECPCLTRGLFTGVEFCLEFDLDTTEVPKGSLNVAVEEGAATDADDKASSANNTTIEYPEPLQFSLAFQDVVGRAVDPLDDGLQNWFQMVVTWDRSVSGFQTSGFQVKYFRTGVTPIEVSVAKITPASGSGANYTLLFDKTETAGSNDGFITLYVPRRAVVDALSSNVYNSYDTRYQVQFVHAESPFLDPSLFQATFTDEVTAEKIPLTVQSAVR